MLLLGFFHSGLVQFCQHGAFTAFLLLYGNDRHAAVDPHKHLRRSKSFLELPHVFVAKGAEVFVSKADDQKCPCHNVIDMAPIIAERTVPFLSVQLSFLITEQRDRFLIGVHGLDVAADLTLERFQAGADLLFIRRLAGLYDQDADGFVMIQL